MRSPTPPHPDLRGIHDKRVLDALGARSSIRRSLMRLHNPTYQKLQAHNILVAFQQAASDHQFRLDPLHMALTTRIFENLATLFVNLISCVFQLSVLKIIVITI